MLEKEFVPYPESLDMKELGFDEPCLQYWNCSSITDNKTKTLSLFKNENIYSVSAPLYQQAFRWFREKYILIYVIVKAESWFFTINGCNTQEGFNTYEEAELACLRKLIELVKQKP